MQQFINLAGDRFFTPESININTVIVKLNNDLQFVVDKEKSFPDPIKSSHNSN